MPNFRFRGLLEMRPRDFLSVFLDVNPRQRVNSGHLFVKNANSRSHERGSHASVSSRW
jgi:hypothetical protein